jgi:DNA-binding NtrC family response regulator
LVDDEAAALAGLAALLEDEHEVYCSGSIASARALLDAIEFDVVVSDYQLPNGSGFDVLRYMRNKSAKTIGLIWTGRADLASARENASTESFRVIPKGDAPDLLLNVVRQSVALAKLRTSTSELGVSDAASRGRRK